MSLVISLRFLHLWTTKAVLEQERYERKMVRSFSLSENVNPKDIYAEFEDGVLVMVVSQLDKEPEEDHRITIR